MRQTFLPIYPEDTKMINTDIGIKKIEDKILYFNGCMPMYQHHIDDYKSFRYITSQMIDLKTVRHVEIISAFKVSKESVNRWLRIYRQEGASGFFRYKKVTKQGTVLTAEVLPKAQELLNLGKSPKEIGEDLAIKPDTIQKAISAHRLTKSAIPSPKLMNEKTQSERSKEDSVATLGVGCTNVESRIDAIFKKSSNTCFC